MENDDYLFSYSSPKLFTKTVKIVLFFILVY
jgi:hypothetical protein